MLLGTKPYCVRAKHTWTNLPSTLRVQISSSGGLLNMDAIECRKYLQQACVSSTYGRASVVMPYQR